MDKGFFSENFDSIGTFVGTIFGAIAGWFTGRKRNNAEIDTIEIGNFAKGFETYQQLLDDLRVRMRALEEESRELSKELHQCKEDMRKTLEERIAQLEPKRDKHGRFASKKEKTL